MNARDARCGQSRKLPMSWVGYSWVGYVPTALPHTNGPGHRGGDRTIGIRGRTYAKPTCPCMHIRARWQTAGEVRKVPTVDIGAGRSRFSGERRTDIACVRSRILDAARITDIGGVRARGARS